MPTALLGSLCTSDDDVDSFLAALAPTAEGPLHLDRESYVWDAFEAAHASGKRGGGRSVAILDHGFDLADHRLVGAWGPTGRAGRSERGHGTAVALLIHEAAPGARLHPNDIKPGMYLHPHNVAEAVTAARAEGVDVINLSLGFQTKAHPIDTERVDIARLEDVDTPTPISIDLVSSYADNASFYGDGGCEAPCPICRAIDQIDQATVAIISAGGNRTRDFCPAVHHRCVSSGFQIEKRIEQDGRQMLVYELPTFEQAVRTEFVMAQPQGFGATSFAAPLLTAACAVDGITGDLQPLLDIANAAAPLMHRRVRLEQLADTGRATSEQGRSLNELFRHLIGLVPTPHRHWDADGPPCVVCSLTVLPIYRQIAQTFTGLGDAAAAEPWVSAALRVCPLWPDLMWDAATVAWQQARAGGTDTASKFGLAAELYERSIDRRSADGPVAIFARARLAELVAERDA